MGIGTALWGGFSSFFSIWQVCFMQISPFFMAYIVGLYLVALHHKADAGIFQWAILPSVAYGTGFTVFYSILLISSLKISKLLLYNISNIRLASGIFILLASLYILLADRDNFLSRRHSPMLVSVMSLIIGVTFAIIYSPCISPTMSSIMELASKPHMAVQGWYLAVWYGIGISIAFGLTGVILNLALRRRGFVMRNARLTRVICALIVLIPALLAIFGLMRHYKAFVLGFMV